MKAFVLGSVLPILPMAAIAEAPRSVADLGWIAGSWVQQQDGETVRELWLAPQGGVMAGLDMTTGPKGRASVEFMKISAEPGGVTFTAILDGQPPTPFVLLPGSGAEEAVFENKAHDFPQRVIYRRCGAELCARIEGTIGGRVESQDWRYHRAPP